MGPGILFGCRLGGLEEGSVLIFGIFSGLIFNLDAPEAGLRKVLF